VTCGRRKRIGAPARDGVLPNTILIGVYRRAYAMVERATIWTFAGVESRARSAPRLAARGCLTASRSRPCAPGSASR